MKCTIIQPFIFPFWIDLDVPGNMVGAFTGKHLKNVFSPDPVQLQMVVSGIINNAAEAIDDTGDIEFDLKSVDVDEIQSEQKPGMQPGKYVRLRVRDTGKGMDAETLQHIFEPFYTKKFPGRGLGMAAVHGIVKNHGGWIGVDSEPGRGTTVQIYFPHRI